MQVSRQASSCLYAAIITLAVILAGVFTAGVPAQAMSVSPVYLDMVSTGPRSRADIRVVNRSERSLPIEAVVSRVTHSGNGTEVVQRDSGDFLVLPMQAMIPPGGSQILKVQWLGDPLIKESRAYRISINQIPVAQPDAKTAVQVVMNLAVVVNVAPPEGQPALELVGSGAAESREGKRVPTVTVRNPSRIHARLPHATLRLSGGSWRQALPPGTLQSLIGIGTVMPGQTRTFTLPLDLPDDVSTVQAQLEYEPPRRR